MQYKYNGQEYELNLIDTPGHVDFHYEVSRVLACCEGAVLLVDAFQGVEAQTVANAYAAMEHDLTIVPVINKIDLTHARVDEVHGGNGAHAGDRRRRSARLQRQDRASACEECWRRSSSACRRRRAIPKAVLQAMVFDSHYDEYRGAVTYVRVMNGTVRKGQKDQFLQAEHDARSARARPVHAPARRPATSLPAGQVGYLICNIKSLGNVHIGDTVTVAGGEPAAGACPAIDEPKRMVFCGLYPSDGQDFEELRDALDKLSINDPSFEFEPETSDALGFGFRCGFLGLLHMEIIQQRLEQEADIDLVQTAPNVTYEILDTRAARRSRSTTRRKCPTPGEIEEFRQPIVRVNFVLPTEYIGPIMKLCTDRRGVYVRTEYLSPTRAMLTYDLPLAEVIYDMHDKLKSVTRGYGTMDYELLGYRPGRPGAARHPGEGRPGRRAVDHLRPPRRRPPRPGRRQEAQATKSPRHMFEIAAAGGHRQPRSSPAKRSRAMRKNVTAKCYGGDITRKRKLWAKQKEGKKRMKSIGQVDIPQKAFLAVLETGEEEGKKK